jgi:hypothetical protein
MKIYTLILLSLISSSSFSQTIIQWEPEIAVADGTLFGNVRPRIALAANDIPVVLFGKGPNGLLHTARMNGSIFSAPISILPPNFETYLASWTGPDLAAKGDTLIAVFKRLPMETGFVYSVRSTDGGNTWSDTIRTDSHTNGGVAWMPSLDIDENGNPSVIYMAHDPVMVNPHYVVTHSTDQGVSYQAEMEITSSIPDEACDCCPAEYVIDGTKHAMLYRNNDNNIRDIYAVYSDNDGITYSQNANVDQLNWSLLSCPSTGPHGIFNNEKLVTVYASRATGSYRVYISETTLSPSFTFSTRTSMTPPLNSNGSQNFPRISGENDTIVMVWQESETSNPEIYSAITTTGAVSELLSTKALVNTITTSSQTNPDVIYANGHVHVVYQDAYTGDVIYRKGSIGTLNTDEVIIPSLKIYPNPSKTGQFHLICDEPSALDFELTDAVGKICPFEMTTSGNEMKLHILDEQNGVFFLKTTYKGLGKTYMLVND